jgi:hypothetical protein
MATNNEGINWGGVGLRIFFATLLVMATYNPTPWSYYDWVLHSFEDFNPLVILAGIVLLIGWSIYIRATMRSLGAFGLVLALAFFGVLLWVIIDWGIVAVENITAVTWIVLMIMSFILGIGMSWSFVRRKISGQQDINDGDDE